MQPLAVPTETFSTVNASREMPPLLLKKYYGSPEVSGSVIEPSPGVVQTQANE